MARPTVALWKNFRELLRESPALFRALQNSTPLALLLLPVQIRQRVRRCRGQGVSREKFGWQAHVRRPRACDELGRGRKQREHEEENDYDE